MDRAGVNCAMTMPQFRLWTLLLGVTVCAVTFAAVRAYPGTLLLAFVAAVITIPLLSLAAMVGIVNEWRRMPRQMRILNGGLIALIAIVALIVVFAANFRVIWTAIGG